jgi:DNA-binding NarL/FixJ family response regulator
VDQLTGHRIIIGPSRRASRKRKPRLGNSEKANGLGSAVGRIKMRKQKLLQRLVGGLATNEGVQPKRTEISRRLKSLTPREVDVLCYILGGQRNREIAAELGITERTIKVHRRHVMEKLGVQSTAQLFPMVLHYIAWPAWPKFRRRRKKPKKRRPGSR